MSQYQSLNDLFNDLFQDVLQLYQRQDFAGALALTEREIPNFPDQRATIYHWQMCFTSLLGRTDQAIALLREALDAGYFFAEGLLRGDSDLTALQGMAEFEALLAINAARAAEAQKNVRPTMRVIEPPGRAASPYPTLIALHGNNSNVDRSTGFWRSAAERGWLAALPQSTQVGGANSFVWDDRAWAARDVKGYLDTLCAEHPVDLERLVIGGFSRGGESACWLAITGQVPARAFVGVVPYIRDGDAWRPHVRAAAERGLRGLLISGEADTACHELLLPFHRMLIDEGLACDLKVYPGMGHIFPKDFDGVLAEMLEAVSG